jgi:hypothetical protein
MHQRPLSVDAPINVRNAQNHRRERPALDGDVPALESDRMMRT